MPLDGDEPAPPPAPKAAPPKPKKDKADLAATSLPTKKVDLSATALPTKKVDLSATSLPVKKEKDIFEDTDFEVDALDASADDRTVQLDASSDFEIDESDSRTDIFALDEDDVNKNAATALAGRFGRGLLRRHPHLFGRGPIGRDVGRDGRLLGSRRSGLDTFGAGIVAVAPSSQGLAPSPLLASSAPTAEWGGLWVGLIMFSTLVVMITTFVTMDLVNNLYEYRGSTVSSGLVKSIASLFPGAKN